MKEVCLKSVPEPGFCCLVYDVRDGKIFGCVSNNAMRNSENVLSLSRQLGIPTCFLAWHHIPTG